MNIETFKNKYASFKDVELIEDINRCDHPECVGMDKPLKKVIIKRNILKHGGNQFICRNCMMKHDNPMNRLGQSRQTDEVIIVNCPDPLHEGETTREMKKSCYYGSMTEPYQQICGKCSQRGKILEQQTKDLISEKLLGRELSPEHKAKILAYRENNPEWAQKARLNLRPELGRGWNKGKTTPQEVRDKMSASMKGRKFTLEHRYKISEGRKKMLEGQGGHSVETRQKISKGVVKQFQNGFNPIGHHRKGTHHSHKAENALHYRSSYEKKAFILLDNDPHVKSYRYECVNIDYFNPVKGIDCSYLVDLLVEWQDGTVSLIEIKPLKLLENPINQAKLEALQLYCKVHGFKYQVWTEFDLFGLTDTACKIIEFTSLLDYDGVKLVNPEQVDANIKLIISEYKHVIDYDVQQHIDGAIVVWLIQEIADGRILLMVNCIPEQDGYVVKDISEIETPVATFCPIRLIDLTEENNPYKNELWRKKVRSNVIY